MVNLDNFVIFIFIIQFIKLLMIKVTEYFNQNQINYPNISKLTIVFTQIVGSGIMKTLIALTD